MSFNTLNSTPSNTLAHGSKSHSLHNLLDTIRAEAKDTTGLPMLRSSLVGENGEELVRPSSGEPEGASLSDLIIAAGPMHEALLDVQEEVATEV